MVPVLSRTETAKWDGTESIDETAITAIMAQMGGSSQYFNLPQQFTRNKPFFNYYS
jgi:hypothetical protein